MTLDGRLSEGAGSATDAEVLVETVLHASADVAFAAWVEASLIELWWGPDGFKTTVQLIEPCAGGRFAYLMEGPSGASCVMRGRFLIVDAPHRLEIEVDDHCNIDLPHGVDAQLTRSRISVEFHAVEAGTKIRLRHSRLTCAYMPVARQSWGMSLRRQPRGA